jgi:flagellin
MQTQAEGVMPQIINTNLASLNAQRNLNTSQNDQSTALQRLSSGLRINSARDDAAGLAISTRFDTQVRGINVAIRNAGDGVSLAQVAEGALGAMTNNLQRIRELALQAANDTNTNLDREALDAEVQQLIAEIDSVSSNAAFNGRKLLDGSFSGATFQTGANVGEAISFDIAKATVDTLGTSTDNGISSFRDTGNSPLAAGDLVINGVAIGNSVVLDDSASTANKDASAISIAAAINRVSERSGVSATVNENVVGGTGTLSAGAGNISINGIAIDVSVDANTSTEANLAAVAQAINERAGETGVRAEVARDPDGGINLIAEDGRNIQLANGGVNTNTVGLAAQNTYTGTYTLVSRDGAPISVSSDSGNIANAGLSIAEYGGTNSGAVSRLSSDLASENPLQEGDLVINGVPVGGTTNAMDSASSANKNQSAIAVAEAINRVSEETGVRASANETRVFSGDVTGGTAMNISINGIPINSANQSDASLATIALVDAINLVSGQTGVDAELVDGDSYVLIAEDGRNIAVGAATTNAAITANVTHSAAITLVSAGQIELSTNTGNIANSRFEVGTYGGGQTGTLLEDVSVLSVKKAEETLTAVDNALQVINIQRANLGAVQNRFESTIANQAIAAENLTAANSRIKDADFAAETAALSRAQVLQQAGISILGQANALPQQVLSLLQ